MEEKIESPIKLLYENFKEQIEMSFDEKKIELFEKLGVPADAYGVGSRLLKEKIDITADVVEVNGKPCAKVGRRRIDNPRLKRVSPRYWEED